MIYSAAKLVWLAKCANEIHQLLNIVVCNDTELCISQKGSIKTGLWSLDCMDLVYLARPSTLPLSCRSSTRGGRSSRSCIISGKCCGKFAHTCVTCGR